MGVAGDYTGPYGPIAFPTQVVYGLFMMHENRAVRELILHILIPTSHVEGDRVRILFKTARKTPVRGPVVWCDLGITWSPRY